MKSNIHSVDPVNTRCVAGSPLTCWNCWTNQFRTTLVQGRKAPAQIPAVVFDVKENIRIQDLMNIVFAEHYVQ